MMSSSSSREGLWPNQECPQKRQFTRSRGRCVACGQGKPLRQRIVLLFFLTPCVRTPACTDSHLREHERVRTHARHALGGRGGAAVNLRDRRAEPE
jgi:hypothetical protein